MAIAVDNRPMSGEQKKVIFASSLGTVFEWYDFYLYGTLAVIIGNSFSLPLILHHARFSRCWLSLPASSCAPLARWCSAVSAT